MPRVVEVKAVTHDMVLARVTNTIMSLMRIFLISRLTSPMWSLRAPVVVFSHTPKKRHAALSERAVYRLRCTLFREPPCRDHIGSEYGGHNVKSWNGMLREATRFGRRSPKAFLSSHDGAPAPYAYRTLLTRVAACRSLRRSPYKRHYGVGWSMMIRANTSNSVRGW